jgi:hypothetical protein
LTAVAVPFVKKRGRMGPTNIGGGGGAVRAIITINVLYLLCMWRRT